MSDVNQYQLDRAASDTLPQTLYIIALLLVLASLILVGFAFAKEQYWVLAPAVSSLLAAPFLYGFADIIQSLRVIALKHLQG